MRTIRFLTERRSASISKAGSTSRSDVSSDDFPLLLRVTNRNNSAMYRLSWSFALGLCWALTIYQIWDRLAFYLSTPIRTSVTTNWNQSLPFPLMTACTMTTVGEAKLRETYEAKLGKQPCYASQPYELSLYGKVLNMSYMKIMKEVNLSKNFVENCNLDFRTSDDFSPGGDKIWCGIQWSESFLGSCITLSSSFTANYSRRNKFSIKGRPPKRHVCETPHLKVLIHQDMVDVVISSLYEGEFMKLDFFANLQESILVSVAEFRNLNSLKNPCTDEDTYKQCINQHFRDAVEAANLKCTFPFLGPSKLNVCSNWGDLYDTKVALENMFNPIKKPCTRKCYEVIFRRYYTKKIEQSTDFYTISIEHLDNLVSLSEEYYAYSFVSLICDVGGNVGLCLGLCLISLLETGELFWKHLVSYMKKT